MIIARIVFALALASTSGCKSMYAQLLSHDEYGCSYIAWSRSELPIRIHTAEPDLLFRLREAASAWAPYIVVTPFRPHIIVRTWGIEDMGLTQLFSTEGGCLYLRGTTDLPADPSLRMVAHEMGHMLGLGHDENPLSVMFPEVTVQESPWLIEAVDWRILDELYGPGGDEVWPLPNRLPSER